MTSSLAWDQLVELRERGQHRAMEAVAADRRQAQATALVVGQAAQQREQHVAARLQHLNDAHSTLQAGCCDVAQLRHARNFIAVLEARIQQAQATWRQALRQHAAARELLSESQQQLRTASAELRAAQEMRTREARSLARVRDQHLDEVADESARQTWLTRQARDGVAVS